jgi:hypothetical protein
MIRRYAPIYSPTLRVDRYGSRFYLRPREESASRLETSHDRQAARASDGSVVIVRLSAAMTTTRVIVEERYFIRRLF